MKSLYKVSGYNMDKIERKFDWLDSQAERINEELTENVNHEETEDERMCRIMNEDHEIYKRHIQWKGRE